MQDETFSTVSGEEVPDIYQLVVEKATPGVEPYDARVAATILKIIEQFFSRVENSLVYICSDADEKALQRHRIFDRWYQHSKYKTVITKLDNVIEVATDSTHTHKLYTSFLFHNDNPQHHRLIAIYNQIQAALNADK